MQGVEEAARRITEARRKVSIIEALPEGCRPSTVAEGYAVQAAIMRLWGEPIAGWKVGAVTKAVREMFAIDYPFLGPVFRGTVLQSPAAPVASAYQHRMIEAEFSFLLGRDLPARADPYTIEEVIGACAAVVPSIELVSPRFPRILTDAIATVIADCGINGGEVLGEPVTGWTASDLASQRVRLTVNGRIVAEGSGADVLGNPIYVLEWLANEMSRRGSGLLAGQFVSTGTCTGIVTLEVGERAIADFGDFGQVEVAFV
jgi:2-keto-4-pentenoate hydratase